MQRMEHELYTDEAQDDAQTIGQVHQAIQQAIQQEVHLAQAHEGEGIGGKDQERF